VARACAQSHDTSNNTAAQCQHSGEITEMLRWHVCTEAETSHPPPLGSLLHTISSGSAPLLELPPSPNAAVLVLLPSSIELRRVIHLLTLALSSRLERPRDTAMIGFTSNLSEKKLFSAWRSRHVYSGMSS
jgi:hypothetical protein